MTSIKDKIGLANSLAIRLSEKQDLLSEDESELVFYYADGHAEEKWEKRMTGRCSIQALVDFKPELEEINLDSHISDMRKMWERVRN